MSYAADQSVLLDFANYFPPEMVQVPTHDLVSQYNGNARYPNGVSPYQLNPHLLLLSPSVPLLSAKFGVGGKTFVVHLKL